MRFCVIIALLLWGMTSPAVAQDMTGVRKGEWNTNLSAPTVSIAREQRCRELAARNRRVRGWMVLECRTGQVVDKRKLDDEFAAICQRLDAGIMVCQSPNYGRRRGQPGVSNYERFN